MDGIDRNVISPSLMNPAWDDLANFVYNPDFDLGVGADFMPEAALACINAGCTEDDGLGVDADFISEPALTSTDCNCDGSISAVEQLQENTNNIWLWSLLMLRVAKNQVSV